MAFEDIKTIAGQQKHKKPPAYPWQELALRVIAELGIPNNKRSAVFKVCKTQTATRILQCLNDTKELAAGKTAWRYFFKLVDKKN